MNEYKRVVPLYYSVPLLAICLAILSLMIFVFNIEDLILLQPTTAVNVGSCVGELNITGGYYVLNTSLFGISNSPNNECLRITADNVVLDGLGIHNLTGNYNPSGNNTLGSIGILIEGDNVLVKNLNISNYETGISIKFSNGSKIQNNMIHNNLIADVNVSSSNYTNISANILG